VDAILRLVDDRGGAEVFKGLGRIPGLAADAAAPTINSRCASHRATGRIH